MPKPGRYLLSLDEYLADGPRSEVELATYWAIRRELEAAGKIDADLRVVGRKPASRSKRQPARTARRKAR